MPVTVSIVEDHQDTRERLAGLLNDNANVHYSHGYASAEEALLDIPDSPPDVVLVDIQLPRMSGIDCVARLKAKIPGIQVLMLTAYEESDLIFQSIRAGASGYLLKNVQFAELVEVIELVNSGGAPMSMFIARKVVDHFREIQRPCTEIEKLTGREQEILTLMAKGRLDKEIASALDISIPAVRTHLRYIYEKLHIQCRTEATLKHLGRDLSMIAPLPE